MKWFFDLFRFPFIFFHLYAIFLFLGMGLGVWFFRGEMELLAPTLAVAICWGSGTASFVSMNIFRYALNNEVVLSMIGLFFRVTFAFVGALVVLFLLEKSYATLILVLMVIAYLLMLPFEVYLTLPKSKVSLRLE